VKHPSAKYLLFLLLVIAACTGRQAKEDGDIDDVDSISTIPNAQLANLEHNNPEFNNWADHYNINITDSFTSNETPPIEFYTYKEDIKAGDYKLYRPLLVYNGDSSKFIDAYGYGLLFKKNNKGQIVARPGEPDVEVAIIDRQTNERKRIFFCGTACIVQKAFWYNDDIVAIAGMTSENAGELFTPVVWFINITNGSTTQYQYNKTVSRDEAVKYLQQEISAKGIVWD
jgi:hypothetical protein